jgi:hypothetical protein
VPERSTQLGADGREAHVNDAAARSAVKVLIEGIIRGT